MLFRSIGIKPNKAEIAYGYIKKGELIAGFNKVLEFKEKPSLEIAEKYLSSGDYVWNSGMYVLSSNIFIEECKKYCSEISNLMEKNLEEFLNDFNKLPSISIDYAI